MLKYILETVSVCESYSGNLKNQFPKHTLKKYFHTNEKLKEKNPDKYLLKVSLVTPWT